MAVFKPNWFVRPRSIGCARDDRGGGDDDRLWLVCPRSAGGETPPLPLGRHRRFWEKEQVGITSHDVLPPRSFRACRGILWGDGVKNAGKQFVCQVSKCGICIFDQCIFFISRPGFQLLFSFYGFKWGFIYFIVHQFMHMVFLCKTIDARVLVFVYAAH